MKINVSRGGDLAITSADGLISFLSGSGRFSVETSRFGFGYEFNLFLPGRFYFVNKRMWRRSVYESDQRIKHRLMKKGGEISPAINKLLDMWSE